ncbi:sarcosine oxidase subunit gamma [Sneathiella sp.]|uniref:sarcosine oxidase subunit gamma n=1 Tax=Sneathiella sp. TaxID=1964365 RepID=UPI0035660BF5
MLERKSPLSRKRVFGKFGNPSQEIGVTIKEIKDFSYLEMAVWDPDSMSLRSKLSELLTIRDLPRTGKSLPLKGGVLLRVGPDRIAYLGEDGPAAILEAAVAVEEGSVVLLSHSRCYLRLGGPRVRNLLRRGLRIDLNEESFAVGDTAFTELHGLGVLLIRRETDQFDLIFMRTTAQNVWHWLTITAAQFGYEVS